MKYLVFLSALVLGSPLSSSAQEMAPGTAQRQWLPIDGTPLTLLPKLDDASPAVELKHGLDGLIQDQNTGVWGVPVPRRGDPDYAPNNLNYNGKIPEGPLVLPARVYSPSDTLDRTLPCILVTNGYGVSDRAPENGGKKVSTIREMAAHGYTGVLVALRQSSSDPQNQQVGVGGYYRFFGEDGVAIINSVVNRLGCGMTDDDPKTAKVGMVGASLVGGSQWAVVAQSDYPVALRAIAPDSAGMNSQSYSTLWFPGGMLPGPLRISRPGTELGTVYPAHRDFDSFWQNLQISNGQLRAAASRRLALLMTGGWDEYNTPGNLDAFSKFNALSGPTYKRLVISPTGHTMPDELYRPLALNWMDHFLKGKDCLSGQPPVLIYVRGVERWRAETSWPLSGTQYVDLSLNPSKTGTVQSINDGSLSAKTPLKIAQASYSYKPDTGPFLHVMISQSVTAPNTRRLTSDETPDEKQVLTWTSGALDEATEITGVTRLDFWAASSTTDADFVASLTDVAPDGAARQIVQGYLNGPRQAYLDSDPAVAPPVPMEPGKPRHFSMQFMPTSIVIQKGHRLRLTLAGGVDVGTGADGKPQRLPQGPGKNPYPFKVTIYQGEKYPSRLIVPIIGRLPSIMLKP